MTQKKTPFSSENCSKPPYTTINKNKFVYCVDYVAVVFNSKDIWFLELGGNVAGHCQCKEMN